MKKAILVGVILCLVANIATATIVQGINIDFVTIGNAGNAADTQVMNDDTTGYGGVGYNYSISKYEITNGQWDAFVLTAGAPTGNLSGAYDENAYFTGTNVPTNEISWYEAAQFCNYLTSGDKSQGAYLFSGDNSNPGDFQGIDRTSAVSSYGIAYVLPTEDEWYKAAYYTGSGYSVYANGQNSIPAADDGWNWSGGTYIEPWDVGTGTEEQNGTYDMMGNVWEWNETLIAGSRRGRRGGAHSHQRLESASYVRAHPDPSVEIAELGFRVASVPEPCSVVLLALGSIILTRRRA